jgi:hypothetical protein
MRIEALWGTCVIDLAFGNLHLYTRYLLNAAGAVHGRDAIR